MLILEKAMLCTPFPSLPKGGLRCLTPHLKVPALGKLLSPPKVVGSDTCLGKRMGDRRADYWRERVIVV